MKEIVVRVQLQYAAVWANKLYAHEQKVTARQKPLLLLTPKAPRLMYVILCNKKEGDYYWAQRPSYVCGHAGMIKMYVMATDKRDNVPIGDFNAAVILGVPVFTAMLQQHKSDLELILLNIAFYNAFNSSSYDTCHILD
ncbi:hypothetical protein Q1695_012223 [Nippostrongylus brasiliensis]|nr:hypothetical protein Q1695_012223 [Nippostrongylus brasiliensis]